MQEKLMDELFIESLQKFGFKDYEIPIYMELIKRDELTAGELHRITGLNRPRMYNILEGMLSKGYCRERKSGIHRHFTATDPRELYSEYQASRERDTILIQQNLEKLNDLYRKGRSHSDSDNPIEVIRRSEQIILRYNDLLRQTKEEFLSFSRSPYATVTQELHQEQVEIQKDLINKGVEIKTIVMLEEVNWKLTEQILHNLLGENDLVKITTYLPAKVHIFDRKSVFMAVPSIPGFTESDFSMVIMQDPGVVEFFVEGFYNHWEKSEDVEDYTKRNKT
jgi:HTH-type transcriptional regulator, sugar sensing transcriptional regulator